MKTRTIIQAALLTAGLFVRMCVANADTCVMNDCTWEYSVAGGGATIVSVTPNTEDIIIPKEIGGYPVIAIRWQAFANCREAKTISYPKGISQSWISVSAPQGWSYDSANQYRSNPIGGGGSTAMECRIVLNTSEVVKFQWKISSERGGDYLKCFVNGTNKSTISGEMLDWVVVELPLEQGAYKIRWMYSKDGSVDKGEDCGWVDFFGFPGLPETYFDYCPNLLRIDLEAGAVTSIDDLCRILPTFTTKFVDGLLYEFVGWFDSPVAGTQIIKGADVDVAKIVSVHSRWRRKENAIGFRTKTFSGSSFDSEGDVWQDDAAYVTSPMNIYTNSLHQHTTVVYGSYMFMVGGETYCFKECYDDFATVKVDDEVVIAQGSEVKEGIGDYTPAESGWHKVEFRVANNGGAGGCQSSAQYGILWKRAEETTWRRVENTEENPFFMVEPPLFTVYGDACKIKTTVPIELQLADGATEGVLFLDGQEILSTTNEQMRIDWQPRHLGINEFVYQSGHLSITTRVNVASLSYYAQPEPNPPMPVDANITITPVTRTFEQGGGGGAIVTSGSGTWTAAVSDPWIVLNATSGSAGNPVAYVVNASGLVGDRVGYVYVSGRVHTVTQHGYASTISPASAEFETQGGSGSVAIQTTGRIAWNAKPNVDWISISPTSGSGPGTINYSVAPYNEVATRTGTITVGDQTFTVTQTGRRIKLSTYREVRTDYFSHVIPVTVNALSSTHWSVTPNATWISVVDAGNGVGSDSVSLAIADNLNGATRYGAVTIGTETLLIVQGEPITILPETATAAVGGANGFISVGAWPEVSWIATIKSNWLSILGNTAQGTGCGNVVYTASPNPTLYERTGIIEVAENGGQHGYPVRTHTVTQPAATASLSSGGYEFEAGGGSFAVTIDTASIVEWKVDGRPDWLTVPTGTTGVGPQTVRLQAAENNTVYPRTVTLKIAENDFVVTQKGRGVEVEYDSILFETDGGMGSFSIHPDGNVAWNAVSSDPTWITVFQNESGTGDAEISYIVSPYVNNGAARTGYIEVGDKKVYVTQRPYEMNIDPYLATVTGDAGSGQVGISAPIGSVWEAIATEPWIKVMTTTGSGNGTVTYQFTENLTGKVRTGKIIISGEEYTINQMYRVVMSVGVEGRGSVTGAGSYDYGADVTLTATPDADYSFSHWSGAANGTDNPVTIRIDEACKATAHFIPFVPTATATANELDGVTISWGALAWAEQYRVYRAEANQKPESSVATIAKGTLTWKDTTAAPGKTYYYWVEAVGSKEQTTSAAVTGMRTVSPTGLAISCVSSLFAGQTANCGCTVSYNNGTKKDVTPTWSVVGSGLTVDASGVLTAGTVANDTIATVQASYTESGITKTASAQVTVYPAFDVNDAASGVGTLSTGGSGAWIGQKKESCGGATALRSTGLASGASAWIGCSVAGAGTLTFKWRKSGTGAGKLVLTVNGSESAVCGEASDTWTTVTKEFYDSGTKNIRWTYFGGSNVDAHGLVAEIVWTPGTAITVNFNANGGSGTMAGMTFLEGADVALTVCAFARTGYVFAGWATSADGEVAYLDGAAVWGMTAPVGGVVTLYAVWTPNAYTVRFAANGGEGTMADEPMAYDVAKALTACAFTRKGYTFAGWATSAGGAVKYANGATVKNLTATAGGTVTLYAKWTPNNYVIDFNPGQGGTGSMSDQPMTYDEEKALYANLFARTGYTFLGWTDDESELEEVLFYDGVVVSNLTDEVDGEYDLYAVWAANEYTVRFNANGGEGAMAEMGFLYDEAQSLPMNAFVRTGHAFAGWAREVATGMSPPQLADADVVSNLTAEANGVVMLYAVWTANPYTIRFNANGGNGTMTDIGCVYGTERPLTVNAFTRKGYAFAGWATSEKGPVAYADGASVTSLTAEANGVVTLYAVWQAGANAVSFDGNGGTPSEASRSVLTDAQVGALPSATRTGWTLVGWFTAASGGTQISTDTVITAAVTFFAQWTANVYSVKFDANGGSGTMANESMTYDTAKSLTACAFTRKGYTFAGWATSAGGAVKYANGATVKNLTATAGGVVTLYAKWTPNNYVIDFNPGQGGTGTMSDQPMTYDEEAALYANLFARTGYTFLGWTDDEGELEDVLYYDGVVVSNLTDEVDGEYDLYAVWAANEYTVRFDANGGEGTMSDQAFLYDEEQDLYLNCFTRVGHSFVGWARSAKGAVAFADGGSASNLTAEADGLVTLYAQWSANPYTVRFDANGGEGEMSDMDCTYGVSKQLSFNSFTRVGYAFAGWATSAKGEVAYANGAAIKSIAASGVVTLYAKWTAVSYSVKFNGNGGSGSMANQAMTYDAEKALTACAFTRTGYTFVGWATTADGAVVYANGQTVKNLIATQGAVVNLYAKWTANGYTVKFNANGGSGTMANEPMTYDAAKSLTACAFTRTGYTFAGWAMSAGGVVKYANGATVKNLTATAGGTVTLYAKWTPNGYGVTFNANGGTGTMAVQAMTYDTAKSLAACGFVWTGYHCIGWAVSPDGPVVYAQGASVNNLTAENGGNISLYAVWATNHYTVKFNANGGVGTMADQDFLYDEEQALRANAFTRIGYAFAGWAREAATGMSPPQLADAEVVSNLTAEADGVVTLYAVWDVTGLVDPAETYIDVAQGEVAPYAAAATVYDGYLYDGDLVVGSVQVKVAKGKTDKKSGVFSAKVTATVQLADGTKKMSFKGGVADETGAVAEMTDKNGNTLAVTVGVNGLGGEFRRSRSDAPYQIDGARNVFSGKSAADKAAAAVAASRYQGAYNIVLDGGTLSVTVDKKGKAKIAGTIEGNNVSATSQLLVGEDIAAIPVVITKKVSMAFCLWVMADGTVEVRGVDGVIAGKAGTLNAGAMFALDVAAAKGLAVLPGLFDEYLPNGIDVAASGKKWVVAGGAKAGKLVLVKGTTDIDPVKSKFTDNMSGLKLTYKSKDGTFKGSFKAYALEKGKIKSYTVNVTGVMIGDVGYGTATIKKPACTFPISIE